MPVLDRSSVMPVLLSSTASESTFKFRRAHQTVLVKFDVHLFPQMSCDSHKIGRVASRSSLITLITVLDNSMASGPPCRGGISQNVFGTSQNMLETPLRGTESTLPPLWQRICTPTAPMTSNMHRTCFIDFWHIPI